MNPEPVHEMDDSFALFHAAHLGHPGPLPEPARQLGQLGGRADDVDLYVARIQIADMSGEADVLRAAVHKIPVAHALDAASYEIGFGNGFGLQRGFGGAGGGGV